VDTNQPQENSQGWYKATILRRWMASLVDGLILLVVIIPFVIFYQSASSNLIPNLLAWGYSVFFVWRFGATLGKKLLKIQVVTTKYEPVSFWGAFLREVVGKFLSSLIFGLGYAWALWDKDRQTWHDKIAGTYVVTKLPNNGKNSGWLIIALVGLLFLIPILAAIVVLIINPLELTRRSRDAVRLSDLNTLQQKINTTLETDPNTSLCSNITSPCMGISSSTDSNITNLNGSGWVKVNLTNLKASKELLLPVDPLNSEGYAYRYCSDGTNWEIDTLLESKQYKEKQSIGADASGVYKIGSDLNICSSISTGSQK